MIPLHAGKTGRGAGYAAVARHFEKSKALIKEKAPMLRNAIMEVMQSSPDKERFSEEMKKEQDMPPLRVILRNPKRL
ncbi:hypothetical protein [Porphyromonas gingivalis]|uniref:hypothetical protein n=1 Tax=Porphyromonas gingivalis TaxID=837 RepID=UPI000B4DF221|nr:hypothetical protein [Porphyromonas gingivalis]